MSTKYPGMMDLDNTKRSCFVSCPRKYYWEFVRNLRPRKGSTALRYGVAWHAGMETMYKLVKEHGWKDLLAYIAPVLEAARASYDKETEGFYFMDDYRTMQNLGVALSLYTGEFSNDPSMIQVEDAETVFELPVLPTGEWEQEIFVGLEPFVFTGKIDLRVLLNGNRWIFEHKTTGQYMDAAISRLHRSPQQIGYYWAAKQLGIEVDGLLVNIHQITARKNKAGAWGEPTMKFQRVPQMYSSFDMADWRLALMRTALEIQWCSRNSFWPMCHDSCYQYGSCAYTLLCEQDGKPLDDRNAAEFVERKWDVREENGNAD